MQIARLADFQRGWFVGDFAPTALRSRDIEVAVHHHDAGSRSAWHEHRSATEITVLVSGLARMAGRDLTPGDVVTLPPGTPADFLALTEAVTVVVKAPSLPYDKFFTPTPPSTAA